MMTRIVPSTANIRVVPISSHAVSEEKYYGILWQLNETSAVGYVGRRQWPNGEFVIWSTDNITCGSRLVCLDNHIATEQVDMNNLNDVVEKLVAMPHVQVYEFTTHGELFHWLAGVLNSGNAN